MLIGILFEGHKDERPLKVIIKRIVKDLKPSLPITFLSFSAEGFIDTKIPVAITEFFVNRNVSLAVFVADSGNNTSRRNKLKKLVKEHNPYSNPIVVACPDPELENWFFEEETAIKTIFRLEGSHPIPYSHLKPKERLEKLFSDSPFCDYTISIYDLYEKIAEKMNLISLTSGDRSPSFKKFYKELLFVLKQF